MLRRAGMNGVALWTLLGTIHLARNVTCATHLDTKHSCWGDDGTTLPLSLWLHRNKLFIFHKYTGRFVPDTKPTTV
jgi:hypothetical protein